jgi:L-2-hydroxyglutarate oxidase LhgO
LEDRGRDVEQNGPAQLDHGEHDSIWQNVVQLSSIDLLVIGAGVTGLAAAGEIAAAGYSVAVAERHPRPGMETSTHNSSVIHAGIYYPAGTLKARLCVEGAERLYSFCAANDVPCDRCGKFIVATEDGEMDGLEELRTRGTANGVAGLEIVDPALVRRREPHVAARAALWSPNTGRVETEALVRALARRAEAAGAILLRGARVIDGHPANHGFDLRLERETISARVVLNAAGLYADDVSRALGGEDFTIYPVRGEYAELRASRRHWVNGLVYPLPLASGHGLGVHLTKTTGGAVLLGPNARYQSVKGDYEGDRVPLEDFVEPARLLLPEVTFDDITYGGSGIRPKLSAPHEPFADFMLRPDAKQPALVHAAGMDSPGLTSCLSVGLEIARMVKERLS